MYATSIAPFKNISSCSYKSHLISDTHKRWNVERHTGKRNLLLETHGRPIGSAAQEYIHQFYLYTHISAIQSIQDIISTCYPDSGITLKTKTFFLGVKHQECNKRPYSAISCLIALRLLVSYRRYCESVVSMNPSSAHTSMALKSEFYDITCDIESTLSDGSDMDEVYRAFVADSMEFFKRWTSDISCYASVDLLYESLEEHLRAGDEAMRYSWSVFVKGGQYYNDAATGGDRQIRMDSNTHISYQYDDVMDNTGVRLIDSVIEGIGFLFMRRVMIECECSNVPVDSNLPLYTVESPENADRMQKLKIFDFLERSLSKTLKERPGGLLGVLHDVVDIQRNNNEFTLGESTGSLAFWKRDVFCNLAQFAFTYCQKLRTSRYLFVDWYKIFHKKRKIRKAEERRHGLEIVLRPVFMKWKSVSLDVYIKEEIRKRDIFLASSIRAMNSRRVKIKLERALESKIKRNYFEQWSFAVLGIGKFEKKLKLALKRQCFDKMLQIHAERTADKFYMLQLIKSVLDYWKVELIQRRSVVSFGRRVLYHGIHQAKVNRLRRKWKLRPVWTKWRAETTFSWAIRSGFIGPYRQKWAIFDQWKVAFRNSVAKQFRSKNLVRSMLRILHGRVDRRVASVILLTRAVSLQKRKAFTLWRMKVNFLAVDSAAALASVYFHQRLLLITAMRQWKRRLLICNALAAQCEQFQQYRNRQLLALLFSKWVRNVPINQAFNTVLGRRSFSLSIECFFKWRKVYKNHAAKMEELCTVGDLVFARLLKLNTFRSWIRKFQQRQETVFGINKDNRYVQHYFSKCAKDMKELNLANDKCFFRRLASVNECASTSSLYPHNPHILRADGFRYTSLLKRGFFFWASSLHFRRMVASQVSRAPVKALQGQFGGHLNSSNNSSAPSSVYWEDTTARDMYKEESRWYTDESEYRRTSAKYGFRPRDTAANTYVHGYDLVTKPKPLISSRLRTTPIVYTGSSPPSAFSAATAIAGGHKGGNGDSVLRKLGSSSTFDHIYTDNVNDSIIVEECF